MLVVPGISCLVILQIVLQAEQTILLDYNLWPEVLWFPLSMWQKI